MKKKDLIEKMYREFEPTLEEMNYEIVDIEYVKEPKGNVLRFYIYKKEGIGLDDCQKVSELVSDRLDELDPIPDAYYLEVSSPGLERPIRTDRDLKKNLMKEITVKFYKAKDGSKEIKGQLIDYTNKSVILLINGNSVSIDRDQIALMKIAF